MAKRPKTFGLLAEYETPQELFHACEQVRDAGYAAWDAYTPFPVHGLEKAMGLRTSLVPWIVPSLVLALGIFVSFLQAFVFSLLTVIYIQLSVAHEEH